MTDFSRERHELVAELELHRAELASQNEELRRANLELSATRHRLAALLDAVPAGIVSVGANGRVTEINATLATMLGGGRETFVDTSVAELVPASGRGALRGLLSSVTEGGGRDWADLVVARRDGSTFRAHLVAVDVAASAESERHTLLAITDMSERAELEDTRRTIDRQLAETSRAESLARMAGGVAHDFNNLLTVVTMQLDFALGSAPSEETRVPIAEAKVAADQAAKLARQMLIYAGRALGEQHPVDVAAAVRAVESILRSSIQGRAKLRLELADGLSPVLGDALQLQQVVINLVANAAEAIGPGGAGTIDVAVHASAESPDARSWLEIVVRDDGPGMPEHVQHKIFEPFYTTKFTGRGLGLSVVAGNVRSHGGSMAVESELGRGTTFRVRLPCADRPAPASLEAASNEIDPARASGWTVLVVDDEPLVRSSLDRQLRALRVAPTFAANGDEALAALARAPAPDVVLLDLTMPGLSGAPLILRIRALVPEVPIIVMSGYSSSELGASREHVRAFLSKPFDRAALLRALDAARHA